MNAFDGAPSRALSALLLWAAAVTIAWFLAMLFMDSAVVGGIYVPLGNDSFYHARRVLDILGTRGFYETDPRIHAPDGRVVPWPWAYDYFLALIARVALWFRPGIEPVAVLLYVPVAFIPISGALFLAATSALRLSFELRAVAMLCFALSPLTQLLHGFGMVDHHYIEHTFVLLQLWLGLQWFRHPGDARWSAALGVALGVAPGFHTGLFVLQLAPLACVFSLWLRLQQPPRIALVAFAIALVIATLLILLPSETFRGGHYEFGLLSWFHLHASASTAIGILFMAWWPCSRQSLLALAVLASAIVAPGVLQLARGAAFVSGGISILGEITEAQSVYAQVTRTLGPFLTASLYSWLFLLAPALLAWNLFSIATAHEKDKLFYAVACSLGLALLLAQFRFHYYGFFALVTGTLVIADRLRERFAWHRGGILVATLAVVLIAYQPPLRARLFQVPPPGMDPEYGNSQGLYLQLATECAADPGVVLANANDGNPILFHTDCGVITNNMIVSSADEQHLLRAGQLYRTRPEQIRLTAPEVRYVLVRTSDFTPLVNGELRLLTDNPVVADLLLADEPPPGFTVLKTVYYDASHDSGDWTNIYARLYKVTPVTSPQSGR